MQQQFLVLDGAANLIRESYSQLGELAGVYQGEGDKGRLILALLSNLRGIELDLSEASGLVREVPQ